jgi:hypothetical protein
VTEIRQRRGESAVWVGHCCCAGRDLSDDVTIAVVVGSWPVSLALGRGALLRNGLRLWCVWPGVAGAGLCFVPPWR